MVILAHMSLKGELRYDLILMLLRTRRQLKENFNFNPKKDKTYIFS